jgi:hypothetical protein
MRFLILFLLFTFVIKPSKAQKTAKERLDSLTNSTFVTDMPQPGAYCLDGLIVSRTRFDSLRIVGSVVKRRTGYRPDDAVRLFGERGKLGILKVETTLVYVLDKVVLVTAKEKRRLAKINESQIIAMTKIDSDKLRRDHGIRNKSGGIEIETK